MTVYFVTIAFSYCCRPGYPWRSKKSIDDGLFSANKCMTRDTWRFTASSSWVNGDAFLLDCDKSKPSCIGLFFVVFRLLRCSVLWGGRWCLWHQNPSSSATRWPVVTFCCSRVQRFYGMSMCSTCYLVRQTKALFLRWEGFRLQAASWTFPLPIFGAAEARREATPGAGDEDDRETLVWVVL